MAITFVGSRAAGTTTTHGFNLTTLTDTNNTTVTLQEGDFVVAVFVVAANGSVTRSTSSTGWTQQANILSDNAGQPHDANFAVFTKFMGSTPDTSITLSGTNDTAQGKTLAAIALRGVDPTTPLDVAVQTASGISTTKPNPPAITPVSAGAWIVALGGSAAGTNAAFNNPGDLSTTTNHFKTATVATTSDASVGAGLKTNWTSGVFDPAAWGTDALDGSWAAVTMALRPAADVGGKPKVYLASAFTAKPLKYWTGSAWVEKPVKFWNGSAWVLI